MGFWPIVGIVIASIIALIFVAVVVAGISESFWYQKKKLDKISKKSDKAEAKYKKLLAQDPENYKTPAFVQGYKDMAKAVDPAGYQLKTEVFDEYNYNIAIKQERDIHRYSSYGGGRYVRRKDYVSYEYKDTVTVNPTTLQPSYPKSDLRSIALKWIEKSVIFDPAEGQTSRAYLVGDEKEYREYFKGGMKFLEDVDNAKVEIFDERDAQAREDRLLEARKKGLAPMNEQWVSSYKALEALRSETFAPTKSWEAQWDELEVK